MKIDPHSLKIIEEKQIIYTKPRFTVGDLVIGIVLLPLGIILVIAFLPLILIFGILLNIWEYEL